MPREEYDSKTATEDVPIISHPRVDKAREEIRKDIEELQRRLPKSREIGIDNIPPLEI